MDSTDGNENVAVSVTMPTELLEDIDSRAKELDLNRSQYFRLLARQDIRSVKSEKKEAEVAA